MLVSQTRRKLDCKHLINLFAYFFFFLLGKVTDSSQSQHRSLGSPCRRGSGGEGRKAIWCFHLLALSLLSRRQGKENFKLFWPLCLVVEAVCDVRDALTVGEDVGGVSPHVSLFFVPIEEFPSSRGWGSPVASPARLGCCIAPCWGE